MQIIVMGTGAFGVPTVRRIIAETNHEIVAVVTMPPRGVSHGKLAPPSPMRLLAEEFDLHLWEAENVNAREWCDLFYLLRVELFFVCDFGCILSPHLLRATRLGGINLHGSLLPKYRGASPVQTAILRGETHSGVSAIHMTAEIDAGPVVAQSLPTPIGKDETHPQLEKRLADLGAEVLLDVIARMESKAHLPIVAQKESLVSRAPRLKKTDGQICWSHSATAIYNQFRALAEWPKSFTFWQRAENASENESGSEPLRLVLNRVEPVTLENSFCAEIAHKIPHEFGSVVVAAGDQLIIACGENSFLRILEIQSAGKKSMPVADFLRGHNLACGDRFV